MRNAADRILFWIAAALLLVAGYKVGAMAWDWGHAAGVKDGRVQMQQEMEAKGALRADASDTNAKNVVIQYRDRIVYRDRYIQKLDKEVKNAAAPLATCPVPDSAVQLWNKAGNCLLDPKSPGC